MKDQRVSNRDDAKWKQRLENFQKHLIENNGQQPKNNKDPNHSNEDSLAQWASWQRMLFHCTPRKLLEWRVKELKAIGFDFSLSQHEQWKQRLETFQEHVIKNNGQEPERNKDPNRMDENRLAKWASQQRTLFHSGELLEWRVKELKAIGFDFSQSRDAKWKQRLENFQKYLIENNGQQPKQNDYPSRSNEDSLATWASRQRVLFHSGKLSPWRIQKLEEIDFDF